MGSSDIEDEDSSGTRGDLPFHFVRGAEEHWGDITPRGETGSATRSLQDRLFRVLRSPDVFAEYSSSPEGDRPVVDHVPEHECCGQEGDH